MKQILCGQGHGLLHHKKTVQLSTTDETKARTVSRLIISTVQVKIK